jgi:NAD(P)-dependent dehydrogenase (short-subunit alcohol dehydrogenase family)
MTSLEGKAAVVTGGSRGIGSAIVEAFVAAGARVLTCGRSETPSAPAGAEWMCADLSDRKGVAALAAQAQQLTGRVDILVNNAGVQVEKTVVDSNDEDWKQIMGVNAYGVFLACREFIPMMSAAGGGAIVNIGSISATHADPSMALYNASKAFVLGLTRSIAVDHGGQGIRCNAICPGWIDTGMADAAFALAKDPLAARADAIARHATGRLGVPADVAKTALWLVSDDAAFVTGQTVTVDGGLVAASPLRPALF